MAVPLLWDTRTKDTSGSFLKLLNHIFIYNIDNIKVGSQSGIISYDII